MPRILLAAVAKWLARLAVLGAAGSGIMIWMGHSVPLHVHMGAGGALVLAAWGAAALGLRTTPWPAFATLAAGMALPVLGLGQIYHPDFGFVLQPLHMATGLAIVALAERLARPNRQDRPPPSTL